MDNEEKKKFRYAIRNMAEIIRVKGNEELSAQHLLRNKQDCRRNFSVLCKLRELLPIIWKEGEAGTNARVEFIKTVWMAGIYQGVIGYHFYDVFDIGERQYDTCFEMGTAMQ